MEDKIQVDELHLMDQLKVDGEWDDIMILRVLPQKDKNDDNVYIRVSFQYSKTKLVFNASDKVEYRRA